MQNIDIEEKKDVLINTHITKSMDIVLKKIQIGGRYSSRSHLFRVALERLIIEELKDDK